MLEYQRSKAEREQAFEKEQERIRTEKEREVARLRALQERARDEQVGLVLNLLTNDTNDINELIAKRLHIFKMELICYL